MVIPDFFTWGPEVLKVFSDFSSFMFFLWLKTELGQDCSRSALESFC